MHATHCNTTRTGKHNLDHRGVRGAHRQRRRAAGALPRDLRGGVGGGAAPAPHGDGQAVPQAAGGHTGALLFSVGVGRDSRGLPRLRVLE